MLWFSVGDEYMKTVTLAIEEDLVRAARKYAQQRGTSINAMIRDILRRIVSQPTQTGAASWFEQMDKANAKPSKGRFNREELYRV